MSERRPATVSRRRLQQHNKYTRSDVYYLMSAILRAPFYNRQPSIRRISRFIHYGWAENRRRKSRKKTSSLQQQTTVLTDYRYNRSVIDEATRAKYNMNQWKYGTAQGFIQTPFRGSPIITNASPTKM